MKVYASIDDVHMPLARVPAVSRSIERRFLQALVKPLARVVARVAPDVAERLEGVREALPSDVRTTVKMRRAFDEPEEYREAFWKIFDAAYDMGMGLQGMRERARLIGGSLLVMDFQDFDESIDDVAKRLEEALERGDRRHHQLVLFYRRSNQPVHLGLPATTDDCGNHLL